MIILYFFVFVVQNQDSIFFPKCGGFAMFLYDLLFCVLLEEYLSFFYDIASVFYSNHHQTCFIPNSIVELKIN